MQRSLRLAGVIVVLVLGCARPAQANIWDILEELSGPGPFSFSKFNVLFSGFCSPIGNAYSTDRKFGIPGQVRLNNALEPSTPIPPGTPCFFVDYRSLATAPDDNFPTKVQALAAEAGVTFPVVRPIEIGFGGGWIRFRTGDISTHRATVTPLRVVVKPIFFIRKYRNDDRLAFLKYYIKETVIIGRLQGRHFGVSDSVFSNKTSYDFVTSAGFIIDVGELLGR